MNGFLMAVLGKAVMALVEAIVVQLALDLWKMHTRSRSMAAVPQEA
ncbi:hypothetical protein ACIREM_23425 [Streptomyces shenzhenensis]